MSEILCTTLPSPIGELLLAADRGRLIRLSMQSGPRPFIVPRRWRRDDAAFAGPRRQLEEYFDGRRTTFELELALPDTGFDVTVWNALREIPYGETISYGELARRIGRPDAVRAVGAANGRNPIAVIVPCHRVIGADGSLTGFGGGLANKRRLLELESGVLPLLATTTTT
jgi:methylated-DNA-[protein]-cysteine S-methyltransferase